MRLIFHWLTLVIGLYLITLIPPLGIRFERPSDLFLAALVFWIFNSILKPILTVLTLPLVLVSLGLFLLIINAALLDWMSYFVPGYHVPGFWSAFFGAIVLSFITGVVSRSGKRSRRAQPVRRQPAGRVIDV